MRTLLRNAPTGLYVQAPDSWTGNPTEAFDFKTMRRAIQFADESGLRRMELALLSDDPDRFTTVPLTALRCRLSANHPWAQPSTQPLSASRPLRPLREATAVFRFIPRRWPPEGGMRLAPDQSEVAQRV